MMAKAGSAEQRLKLIHGAIAGGVVLLVGAFAYLRGTGSGGTVELGALLVQVIFYAVFAAGVAVNVVTRRAILSRPVGEDRDAWWQRATPQAIVIWATNEAVSLIGLVFWWLTANPWFAALTGVGLLGLALNRPSNLRPEN